MLETSEAIPSRVDRGLSHLEVVASGRRCRQLASRGIDRGVEGLLRHLESFKVTVSKSNKQLREAVNNSWVKLRKYYNLTNNDHGIYAAVSLLHPCLRLAHFKEHWIGEMVHG